MAILSIHPMHFMKKEAYRVLLRRRFVAPLGAALLKIRQREVIRAAEKLFFQEFCEKAILNIQTCAQRSEGYRV
jgi:hypothetical protein